MFIRNKFIIKVIHYDIHIEHELSTHNCIINLSFKAKFN